MWPISTSDAWMPDQLAATLGLIGLGVLGASIWFVFFRGWAHYSLGPVGFIGMPWLALAFGILLGAHALGDWDAAVGFARDVLFLGSIVLCVTTMAFQRPMWALPPWYRSMKDEESRAERNGAGPRSVRRRRSRARRGSSK